MPNKCAGCGKIYEDHALEVASGCSCGSTLFIYQQEFPEQEESDVKGASVAATGLPANPRKPVADIPEGSAPGPAAFQPDDHKTVRSKSDRSAPESREAGKPDVDTSRVKSKVRNALESLKRGEDRPEDVEFDMESIKVIEEGVYDINLSKLTKREPLIVEIKEDGKYFVHLASVFKRQLKVEDEALEEGAPHMSARRVENILGGTVKEAKKKIRKGRRLNLQTLLDAEKHGKNRKTLVSWLEKRIDS